MDDELIVSYVDDAFSRLDGISSSVDDLGASLSDLLEVFTVDGDLVLPSETEIDLSYGGSAVVLDVDQSQFDELMALGTSLLLVGLFVLAVLLLFFGSFLASLFFRDWKV